RTRELIGEAEVDFFEDSYPTPVALMFPTARDELILDTDTALIPLSQVETPANSPEEFTVPRLDSAAASTWGIGMSPFLAACGRTQESAA
ncbi:hypothetical protein LZB53_09165, partial [Campylobacter coli]|uniref:hypothetical protein n=1 Tax=Campylobacter coli TaxID=195 RepID=UPI001F08E876